MKDILKAISQFSLSIITIIQAKSLFDFSLIAATTITNSGSTTVLGDIALYPGTSVTGLASATISGGIYLTDHIAKLSQTDSLNFFNYLESQSTTATLSALTGLDNLILTSGVYAASSSLDLARSGDSTLTFDGSNNPDSKWIFKIGSTLKTGAGGIPQMNLINGAQSCNIFWQVGSSATLNIGAQLSSVFLGSLFALTSITINGGQIRGTSAALNGAITISSASDLKSLNSICLAIAPSKTPSEAIGLTKAPSRKPSKSPVSSITKKPSKIPTTIPSEAPTKSLSPRSCIILKWTNVWDRCRTHQRMTKTQCEVIQRRWSSGNCIKNEENVCEVPKSAVIWLGKGEHHDGGCMVWFDCYQIETRRNCKKLKYASCFWIRGLCRYVPE